VAEEVPQIVRTVHQSGGLEDPPELRRVLEEVSSGHAGTTGVVTSISRK